MWEALKRWLRSLSGGRVAADGHAEITAAAAESIGAAREHGDDHIDPIDSIDTDDADGAAPEPPAGGQAESQGVKGAMSNGDQNIGKIVQVIGPTVDCEFRSDRLPEIMNAIKIKDDHAF